MLSLLTFLAYFLTVSHLIDLLGGNENLSHVVVKSESFNLGFDILLGFLLLTSGDPDDIPFLLKLCHCD